MSIDLMQKEKVFFISLFFAALLVNFLIFLPYLGAILVGGVFTILVRPLYRKLCRILGDKEEMAAFLTVCIVLVLILAPLIFLGSQVIIETEKLYASVAKNGNLLKISEHVTRAIEDWFAPFAPGDSLVFNVNIILEKMANWIFIRTASLFGSAFRLMVNLLLSLITLYYFLKEGHALKQWLHRIVPMADKQETAIMERLEQVAGGVVRGSLLIGLLKGILTGIGFALFGVPNAALWGSVAIIASLVPGIGTALVIVPAVVFLFNTDHLIGAVGLSLWGALIVGLIDNILNPILIGKAGRIHPLLVLFSVLGGITVLGPIGFIAGPLLTSLLLALFDIYAPAVRT